MRRTQQLALAAVLAIMTGCGGGGSPAADNDAFATYEACWQEHHEVESFYAQQAIEICCIDHPIGGAPMNTVCGASAATCEAYVGANLMGSDASGAVIAAACTDHVVQRSE